MKDGSYKQELVQLLRDNPTQEVINELILGHLALGMSTVGYYIAFRDNRIIADELMGAMLEAVVDAVNQFATRCEHDNLSGYVTEVVHSYLSKVLEQRPVVRVRGSTQRMRKLQGRPYLVPPEVGNLDKVDKGYTDQGQSEVMVHELVSKVCTNPRELEILTLRLEGYTDSEIGELLGLDRKTVWLIRQSIRERFVELST